MVGSSTCSRRPPVRPTCEPDLLRLPAGQRGARAVQVRYLSPHRLEEPQPRRDLAEDRLGDPVRSRSMEIDPMNSVPRGWSSRPSPRCWRPASRSGAAPRGRVGAALHLGRGSRWCTRAAAPGPGRLGPRSGASGWDHPHELEAEPLLVLAVVPENRILVTSSGTSENGVVRSMPALSETTHLPSVPDVHPLAVPPRTDPRPPRSASSDREPLVLVELEDRPQSGVPPQAPCGELNENSLGSIDSRLWSGWSGHANRSLEAVLGPATVGGLGQHHQGALAGLERGLHALHHPLAIGLLDPDPVDHRLMSCIS